MSTYSSTRLTDGGFMRCWEGLGGLRRNQTNLPHRSVTGASCYVVVMKCYIMVALWNRADHYIFALRFLSSFFLSSPTEIGCLPYFHTWCSLSANLECMSEMCCTRLAENTGREKVAKNRHLGTIAQFCRAISSQLRHASTIGKKTC